MRKKWLGFISVTILFCIPWQVQATAVPYVEEFDGTAGNKVVGWKDATDVSDFNATCQYAPTISRARITRTSSSNWGKVLSPTLVISVGPDTSMDVLEIKVDGISQAMTWKLGIQEMGGAWRHWTLQNSSSATGVMSFNYSSIAQWSPGTYTVAVEIIVEGMSGEYMDVDRLIVSSSSPVNTPTPILTPTITPTPTKTLVPTPVPGVWELMGGQVDNGWLDDHPIACLQICEQVPYVVWVKGAEYWNALYMSCFSNGQWIASRITPINFGGVFYPSLSIENHVPYVSFLHSSLNGMEVLVSTFQGGQWGQLGGDLRVHQDNDHDAFGATGIEMVNGSPVVIWVESKDNNTSRVSGVYVKKWNGSTWEQLGNDLRESDYYVDSVSLCSSDSGELYAAYWANNPIGGGTIAYVKHWNGSHWEQVGNTIWMPDSGFPKIKNYGGTVYLAVGGNNYNGYLYQLNGNQWTNVGGTVPGLSDFALAGGQIGVGYWETGTPIQAMTKHYDGLGWIFDASMNISTDKDAGIHCVEADGDLIYVLWREDNKLYCRRANMTTVLTRTASATQTISVTRTPTPSQTPTRTITLTVTHTKTRTESATYTPTATTTPTPTQTQTPISTATPGPTYVWSLLGDRLNTLSADLDTLNPLPGLAYSANNLYALWVEEQSNYDHLIYVKHWDGSNWIADGGSINDTSKGWNPALAVDNGTPYVAWMEPVERKDVFVKKLENGQWIKLGGGLKVNGTSDAFSRLDITAHNGTPYVAWCESGGNLSGVGVYVKHWDGSNWVMDGNDLRNGEAYYVESPSIAISDSGKVYVAYEAYNPAVGYVTYVKYLENGQWLQKGGVIPSSCRPRIVLDQESPFLLVCSKNTSPYYTSVKKWEQTQWVSVGNNIEYAWNSDLTIFNNALFVGYITAQGQAGVSHFNGVGWISDGLLNQNVSNQAWFPSLLSTGDRLVTGWRENANNFSYIYIKQFAQPGMEPPTLTCTPTVSVTPIISVTPTKTPTATSTSTATVSATATPLPEVYWLGHFDEGMPGMQPYAWLDETDVPDFNAEIAYASTPSEAVVSRTAEGTWGKVLSFVLNPNVDNYPMVEFKVNTLSAQVSWKVGIQEVGGAWNHWTLQNSSLETGTFNFNYKDITGWTGVHEFRVEIIAESAVAGEHVNLDYVKICRQGSVQGSAVLGAFHLHPSTKTPTPTRTVTTQSSATCTPTPKNTMTQFTMTSTSTATVTPTSTPWLNKQNVMVYPNPARGRVMFAYTVSGAVTVTLDLYKINGERVAHISEAKDGGMGQTLTTLWEAAGVAPGIYISRLCVRDGQGQMVLEQKKKVALVK